MLPIKTILHPTDFSVHSKSALPLACALARDYGARLVALHVAPLETFVYGEGYVPPAPEEVLAAAQEQMHHLQPIPSGVRLEERVEQGDAAAEVLRVARDIHADLIVMGTHGRRGLNRLLMGSVAEQVLRQAPCPVLTIRNPLMFSLAETAPAEERMTPVNMM